MGAIPLLPYSEYIANLLGRRCFGTRLKVCELKLDPEQCFVGLMVIYGRTLSDLGNTIMDINNRIIL